MSTLKDRLRTDLHASMRERDALRSATIRMALTAVQTAEVAGTTARELSDDEVLKVLGKEAKKRREAAVAFEGANRPELASKELAELQVLDSYLPAQLSENELDAIAATAAQQSGATGMPQMGLAMKAATALVAGRADGGRVAAAVRRRLTAG